MLKKNPIISVVLSVYNGEKTLSRSISSILNQTLKNFEFIIIDDCSIDNSLKIIRNFIKKDRRIILITNRYNIGLTRSLNLAIKNSKGEFIARIDADEYSKPTRLEKQLMFLKNENFGLVGSKCINIYKNDRRTTRWKYLSEVTIKKILRYQTPFAHGTAMFSKKICFNAGLYNEKFITSQDYELWLKISKLTKVGMIDENLVFRYINEKSISNIMKFQQFKDTSIIRFKNARKLEYLNVIFYSLFFLFIAYLPKKLFLFIKKKKLSEINHFF